MNGPTRLRANAPAKVNLGLEVVGRRPDGYHELVTLLQTVSLHDTFEWTATGAPFTYVGPPTVPPEADLVARVLASASDRDRDRWTGELRLEKRIPMAAGLGGGSSDAALALRLAFPRSTPEELHERATALGADVPFFLRGGCALATGTGTALKWLPTLRFWLVMVTPPLAIEHKTAALYGGLIDADFSAGHVVRDIAAGRDDVLKHGQRATESSLPNAFLRQLLEYETVRYAYDALRRTGAGTGGGVVAVSASGAGPTVYALTHVLHDARRIAEQLPADVGDIHIVHSIGRYAKDHSIERMANALRGTTI